MKVRLSFLLGFFTASLSTLGQTAPPAEHMIDRIEFRGVTYTNVALKVINPAEGLLGLPTGGAKVMLSTLPEPYRTRIYNEAKASQFEGEQKAKSKAKTNQLAKSRLEAFEKYKAQNYRIVDGKEVNTSRWIEKPAKVTQVTPTGLICLEPIGIRKNRYIYDDKDRFIFVLNFDGSHRSYEGNEITYSAIQTGVTNVNNRILTVFDCGKPYVPKEIE